MRRLLRQLLPSSVRLPGYLLLPPVLLLLAPGLSACLSATTGRSAAASGAVVPLQIAADPPDVEIYLDGEYRGELARWRDRTLPVAPGPHRIELRREGYFPLRREIEVGPDGASFKATLRRLPP